MENLEPIFSTWGSHRPDFEWLEKQVIYGLMLSDHSVLSDVETELVVVPAIMCQDLASPTVWHLRGTRRLGVSAEDVDAVRDAVALVGKWAGKDTTQWPSTKDIKDQI